MSAGTTLPASKITISPTTISEAGIITSALFLITCAVGELILFNASMEASAFFCCTTLIIAFKKTMNIITYPSINSSKKKDKILAKIRIIIIGSFSSYKINLKILFLFFLESSLSP